MTLIEANDAILGVFLAVWKPLNHPVKWTAVPGDVPTTDITWARVTLRHADANRASLTGGLGSQKWTSKGTLFVQIFTPIGKGVTDGYSLSELVMNAYRSCKIGVTFPKVKLVEVGQSGKFEQINVVCSFEYDTVNNT